MAISLDQLEQELRINQMIVNIEKMRADMQSDLAKQQQHLNWETRKFVVSLIVAVAVAAGAGASVMSYIDRHTHPQLPSPVPNIVINIPSQPAAGPVPPPAR